MELYDALLTTRAMRRYRDDPVTDDEIERCLRAAQQAPSGGNLQPWQYLIVTDPERRARVGELYKSAYDRYERTLLAMTPRFRTPEDEASWRRTAEASRHLADHFGEAPALVLFLLPMIEWMPADDEGRMDIGPLYASVYPAVQNFMLAARGLGIGTTLTTVFRIYQDEVRASCTIPKRYEVVAMIPMGRPRKPFRPGRGRRPIEQVTHWNRFGNRRAPSE